MAEMELCGKPSSMRQTSRLYCVIAFRGSRACAVSTHIHSGARHRISAANRSGTAFNRSLRSRKKTELYKVSCVTIIAYRQILLQCELAETGSVHPVRPRLGL